MAQEKIWSVLYDRKRSVKTLSSTMLFVFLGGRGGIQTIVSSALSVFFFFFFGHLITFKRDREDVSHNRISFQTLFDENISKLYLLNDALGTCFFKILLWQWAREINWYPQIYLSISFSNLQSNFTGGLFIFLFKSCERVKLIFMFNLSCANLRKCSTGNWSN